MQTTLSKRPEPTRSDDRLIQDLYFSTFRVRLESRYVLAVRPLALTPEEKVQLIHDILLLTDRALEALYLSPTHIRNQTDHAVPDDI